MGSGAWEVAQIGAPTLEVATEVYLARPKLRSETHKNGTLTQLELHLKDRMRLPLDEISRALVVCRYQDMSKMQSGANHALRSFRPIYNHACRTYDLAECPTMAIEWFEESRMGVSWTT